MPYLLHRIRNAAMKDERKYAQVFREHEDALGPNDEDGVDAEQDSKHSKEDGMDPDVPKLSCLHQDM